MESITALFLKTLRRLKQNAFMDVSSKCVK